MSAWYESYGITKPYYADDAVCIIHGDCRDILPALKDKSVDLVLTDPFYVPQTQYSWKLFDEFYWSFNAYWMGEIKRTLKDEFHLLVSFASQDMCKFENFLVNTGFEVKSRIVWNYRNSAKSTANETQYAKTYEFIWHCSSGKKINFSKTWSDRRFDVQTIAMPQSNFTEDPKIHQYQKPASLYKNLIEDCSFDGELVLDPFLGSGTTAYCAKKLGRKCIGIEIEEKYCEIAAERCRQTVMRLDMSEQPKVEGFLPNLL